MASMPPFSFGLPAFIKDFDPSSANYANLKNRWNISVGGWIDQAVFGAMVGNSLPNAYNPASVPNPVPANTPSAIVTWVAFPARVMQYFSADPPVAQTPNNYNLTPTQIFQLADYGYYTNNSGQQEYFQPIPSRANLCPQANWNTTLEQFGSFGPRGWMDEYCEWSCARDGAGDLLRVDFACENPEYWNTLWKVDPNQVAALYESTLNAGAPQSRWVTVSVTDLQLFDVNGNLVIDPDTGRPAYNPLNKWNCGPHSVRTGDPSGFTGGLMHLTSTANTLQTELGLAVAATVQYPAPAMPGNSDPQALICCAQYGQPYRNSDPHIGQTVNQVVGGQALGKTTNICLADPVGLYIQMPPDGVFQFGPTITPGVNVPATASPMDVWSILRGAANVADPVNGNTNFPGNMILHAACQIPASWLAMSPSLTLADMQINGQPIQWGGQIASQFNIGLYARPIAAPGPLTNATACAGGPVIAGQPLQCMWAALWSAYYPLQEPCRPGTSLSLASNTTFIAPWVPNDGSFQQLVITCNPITPGTEFTVQILDSESNPDPTITTAVFAQSQVSYAVPGNTNASACTAVTFTITVPTTAATGLRGLQISGIANGGGILPAAIYIATPNS